jgi:hypothetical protein
MFKVTNNMSKVTNTVVWPGDELSLGTYCPGTNVLLLGDECMGKWTPDWAMVAGLVVDSLFTQHVGASLSASSV